MTVAVACNLSEGVILGVDSAVTLGTPGGVVKVYENADKLFQLGDRPIGVAVYGLAALGNRNIGSYLHELEILNPKGLLTGPNWTMASIVEEVRAFLMKSYQKDLVSAWEAATGRKWRNLRRNKRPVLGVIVGGFSSFAYLSEVWQIELPFNNRPGSARLLRPPGSFGTNWFAMFDPIRRYIKGYDPALVDAVVKFLVGRAAPLSPAEDAQLRRLIEGFEYQIPYVSMPMEEGVAHTRFLVELVVSHHRYAVGAPVVGGRAHVGRVTYRGTKFELLE
jgi:hypothetical protein